MTSHGGTDTPPVTGTHSDGPWWNRLLNALLAACVGALFGGIAGAAGTFFVYCLGLVPGVLCGALLATLATRRTPLRESIVLFVGCAATASLVVWRGSLGAWGDLWILAGVGLGGPLAGVLLQGATRSWGPAPCRRAAWVLGVGFILALSGLAGWWIYRPLD